MVTQNGFLRRSGCLLTTPNIDDIDINVVDDYVLQNRR